MKKIIFGILVVLALFYLGVIKFTNPKVNENVKSGVNKALDLTKKGVNTVVESAKRAEGVAQPQTQVQRQ